MERPSEPVFTIKRKPKKVKYKPEYVSNKMRKEADPTFIPEPRVFKTYDQLTDEERDAQKKRVCESILKRKASSPRFNSYKNRTISETNYRLYRKQTKICTHCNRELGLTFFDKQKDKRHSKKYRRPYCVDCRKKKNREYYLKRKGHNDT